MQPPQKIDDIGQLSGKLLLFGGPYSNLQALQALQDVATAARIPPSNIICTGDIVGYCAQPVACIALTREWGIRCIAGNVEIQLRNGEDNCGCDFREDGRCDLFSRSWYAYAKAAVSGKEIAWMAGLPDAIRFTYSDTRCIVLHGSAFHTAGYIFASTPWAEKEANFEAADADLIIAGHSGLPFCQQRNNRCWINAGVIGMPANDGDTRVWYAVLDTTHDGDWLISLRQLEYDFKAASQKMLDAKLPAPYARTLTTGIWDNCEILPQPETEAQGRPIKPSNFVISK